MTTLTIEQEIEQGAELLSGLHAAVRSLRREIILLARRFENEETVKPTSVKSAMSDVSGLIAQCTKAELNLNEYRKKQAGIAQGTYALDLEHARAEIGCKLDRLRRCRDTDPVSG